MLPWRRFPAHLIIGNGQYTPRVERYDVPRILLGRAPLPGRMTGMAGARASEGRQLFDHVHMAPGSAQSGGREREKGGCVCGTRRICDGTVIVAGTQVPVVTCHAVSVRVVRERASGTEKA